MKPFNVRSSLGSEQRAQAALVDSLFFIAIIATLCTGLFYFAINYGTSTQSLLTSFYSSDFAMDALKVVTYATVLRDGQAITVATSVPNPNAEYDYLLALIKEDYARNKTITFPTKLTIANTLNSVLRPFNDSLDYAFFIIKEAATTSESKYLTLVMAVHEVTDDGSGGFTVERKFFACTPKLSNVLEKKVFPKLGKVDSATGSITLGESSGTSSYYVMGLSTWVSQRLEILKDLGEENDNFDCNELLVTAITP